MTYPSKLTFCMALPIVGDKVCAFSAASVKSLCSSAVMFSSPVRAFLVCEAVAMPKCWLMSSNSLNDVTFLSVSFSNSPCEY